MVVGAAGRRALAIWVAGTLLGGLVALGVEGHATGAGLALDAGAGAGHAATGATRGADAPAESTSFAPPTTVPLVADSHTATTEAPAPPGANPTTGDVPPDTRPLDDVGARIGPLPPGGTVAGRITGDDGAPAAGICVAGDGPWASIGTVSGPDGRWAVVVADSFGMYVPVLHLRDCDPAAPHWMPGFVAGPMLVVTGRTTTVDTTLARAGRIDVVVVDGEGEGEAGICVVAAGVDGPVTAITGSDGRATLAPAAPGPQTVALGPTCSMAPLPFPEQGAISVPDGGVAAVRLVMPRPPNDDRARAWPATPGAEVSSGGVLASLEPGEALPSCYAGVVPAGTVWYRRAAGAAAPDGRLWNVRAGDAGTAVAAYREVAGTLVEAGCLAVPAGFPAAELALPVAPGEAIWFQLVAPTTGMYHAVGVWSES